MCTQTATLAPDSDNPLKFKANYHVMPFLPRPCGLPVIKSTGWALLRGKRGPLFYQEGFRQRASSWNCLIWSWHSCSHPLCGLESMWQVCEQLLSSALPPAPAILLVLHLNGTVSLCARHARPSV